MHADCMQGVDTWVNVCMQSQDAAALDSDEEDEFVYNPLKLPMGWDGKPIPYWLYKLHGLNQVRMSTLTTCYV